VQIVDLTMKDIEYFQNGLAFNVDRSHGLGTQLADFASACVRYWVLNCFFMDNTDRDVSITCAVLKLEMILQSFEFAVEKFGQRFHRMHFNMTKLTAMKRKDSFLMDKEDRTEDKCGTMVQRHGRNGNAANS